MEKIKKLAFLTQQIGALMDEMNTEGNRILSVEIIRNMGTKRIHLHPKVFFELFRGFKIEHRGSSKSKFEVSKTVNGVVFFAVTNNLSGLKITKNRLRRGNEKAYSLGNASYRKLKK